MKKIYILLFICICIFCAWIPAKADYAPGRILIKTTSSGSINIPAGVYSVSAENVAGIMPSTLQALSAKYRIKNIRRMHTKQKLLPGNVWVGKKSITVPDLTRYYEINVPDDVSIESMIEDFKKDPNVEYVGPEYIYKTNFMPNDPAFTTSKDAWYYFWPLRFIGVDYAWDITTGANGQIIAVIDTGVDYTHEDLKGKVILGHDFVNNDDDPMDDFGHGTFVAGEIGAIANNGIGIAGVDWGCKILAIKSLDADGFGTDAQLGDGVQYAADHGASIINMSLGGSGYDQYFKDSIDYAYAAGCVIVAAAGNENTSSPSYPAAYDHVIAVAAIDENDQRTLWLPFQGSNYGNWVDICAPGIAFSTLPGNKYGNKEGTSMAAPLVAGTAGLLKALKPSLTEDDVESILKSTATNIDSENPGYEGMLGAGKIDAFQACLSLALPPASSMPVISDFVFDNYGNEYVLYCQQGMVVKYNSNGLQIASINGFNGKDLIFPYGIALSPNGDKVYVSDTYNNRVIIFNSSLQGIKEISGSNVYATFKDVEVVDTDLFSHSVDDYTKKTTYSYERFGIPQGISVDNNGCLYVADTFKDRVLKFNKDGNAIRFNRIISENDYSVGNQWLAGHTVSDTRYSNALSGTIKDHIIQPSSVTVKNNSDIYVADTGNNRIQQFNYDGNLSRSIAGLGFNSPFSTDISVITSEAGDIYVADKGNSRIQRYDKDIKYICTYGDSKLSPSPLKVLVRNENGTNKLYFCDAQKYKIQSCLVDSPPSDFHVTMPIDKTYYVNDKGMDISWISDHSDDFIKVQKYQIVGKRSDRNYWEVILDDLSPGTRSVRVLFPSEGIWAVCVRAFNGTAYRYSDGGSEYVTANITGDAHTANKEINAVADSTPSSIYDIFSDQYYSPLIGPYNLAYKVSDAATTELQSVSAAIYNKNNNCVKQLILDEPSECGQFNASWNGRDINGNFVSDGDYSIVVQATDEAGNMSKSIKMITVDTAKPTFCNFSISTTYLTPNGDGINDDTAISFSVSKNSNISLLFNNAGKTIRKIDLSNVSSEAINKVVWDGKSDAEQVIRGTIEVSAIATDIEGNKTTYVSDNTIYVETSNYLLDANADPDSVSQVILFAKPVVINYSVPDTCTVESYVTSNGATIFTLIPSKIIGKGNYKIEWAGKDDNGNNVKEGNYNYVFSAITPNKVMTKSGIISVDNTKPYATQLSIAPMTVNIKSFDEMSSDLVLSYYLSEKCCVTADILDSTGQFVSNIASDDPEEAGNRSLHFNKNALLKSGALENDSYTFRLHLVDEAGNDNVIDSLQLKVEGFHVSDVSVSPSTFTPNGDGHDDFVTIQYSSFGGSGQVNSKLSIKNSNGSVVRSFDRQDISSRISEVWDGNAYSGAQAPDGVYRYEISATDDSGVSTSTVSGEIALVRDPTIVMYALPLNISPNGDGVNDYASIYYAVNYHGLMSQGESHIEISIYDLLGNKVYYYPDSRADGGYSRNWSGENNQQTGVGTVNDGTYKLQVKATDPGGAVYWYNADITVNRSGPVITDRGVTVPIITPNGDDQQDTTTILYSVQSTAAISSIEVKIYDSSSKFDPTTLVRTLSGSSSGETIWDGTVDNKGGNGDQDDNGYADKGLYKYVIEVTDAAGNKTTCVSKDQIQVDKVYLNFVPPITEPSEPYFSPNGDGVKDNTVISWTLTTTDESNPVYAQSKTMKTTDATLTSYIVGKVSVKIKDLSGNTIKTLLDSSPCYKDQAYTVTWDGTGTMEGNIIDGDYTIEVTAVDLTGDPATNNILANCVVNRAPPAINIISPANNSWQKGTLDVFGCISDTSPVSYSCGYGTSETNIATGEGVKSNEKLVSWDTTSVEGGSYDINLYAVNNAGNTSKETISCSIDNDPPSISGLTTESNGQPRNNFNPYLDSGISIKFTANDNSFDPSNYAVPAQNVYLTAEVWLDVTKIATLNSNSPISSGPNSVKWNGQNSNGDYVNEGAYKIKLFLTDQANNGISAETTVVVSDDQQITNLQNNSFSHDPLLSLSNDQMNLKFATGPNSRLCTIESAYVDSTSSNCYFEVDPMQTISGDWRYYFQVPSGVICSAGYHIYDTSNNAVLEEAMNARGDKNGDHYPVISMFPGRYRINVWGDDGGQSSTTAKSRLTLTYAQQVFSTNGCFASDNLCRLSGFSATNECKPFEISAYYSSGASRHAVWTQGINNNSLTVNYAKVSNGTYGTVKSIVSTLGASQNPSIACDSSGNKVYVAWEEYPSSSGITTLPIPKGEIHFISSTSAGATWGSETQLIVSSDSCATPSIACDPTGNIIYVVYANGYQELDVVKSLNGGASWTNPVRITGGGTSTCEVTKPSVVCDSSGNGYIAWEDTRTGTSEVWFQKIPSNFVPFTNSNMTTMSISNPMSASAMSIKTQSAATAELISPTNSSSVNTLRPTFKWFGVQNVTDYKIECATTSDADALTNSANSFMVTVPDASSSQPLCVYSIPEHSTGLAESSNIYPKWYWRVEAITTEASTSEVGVFNVQLSANISDVTNWPNPFNPNKEKTNIRYRLGKTADKVMIYIFDLTGALVKQLSGSCNAEGPNVWNKYNEVEWDGRNGRGDIVLNGVYPFEILVTAGNKTVSCRGKIVVLK